MRNRGILSLYDNETLAANASRTYWFGPAKGTYWLVQSVHGSNDTRPIEVKAYKRMVGGVNTISWNGVKVCSQDVMRAEVVFLEPLLISYGEEIGVRMRGGITGDAIAGQIRGVEVYQ